MIKELKPHDRTRRIMVGDVPVGGGAPVAVQSMLNAAADDVAANLAQIEALAEAGCEIVRMAIPPARLPGCVRGRVRRIAFARGGRHPLRRPHRH